MKRLFELREAGKLRRVILPYLGQDDSRLKFPTRDLVTREQTYSYPTDFNAMSEEWIERLTAVVNSSRVLLFRSMLLS
ncbi:MAG TPA: hypothetical protein VG758_17460 [Hyphomicrobiaceae bacterium]|nr:hypothetical protein [Hyphomicrobiaceae bacterium]